MKNIFLFCVLVFMCSGPADAGISLEEQVRLKNLGNITSEQQLYTLRNFLDKNDISWNLGLDLQEKLLAVVRSKSPESVRILALNIMANKHWLDSYNTYDAVLAALTSASVELKLAGGKVLAWQIRYSGSSDYSKWDEFLSHEAAFVRMSFLRVLKDRPNYADPGMIKKIAWMAVEDPNPSVGEQALWFFEKVQAIDIPTQHILLGIFKGQNVDLKLHLLRLFKQIKPSDFTVQNAVLGVWSHANGKLYDMSSQVLKGSPLDRRVEKTMKNRQDDRLLQTAPYVNVCKKPFL